MDTSTQQTHHWQRVSEFHRDFHQTAADVVVAIQSGKRDEAETSLNLRGDLSRATSRLIQAMVDWLEASG